MNFESVDSDKSGARRNMNNLDSGASSDNPTVPGEADKASGVLSVGRGDLASASKFMRMRCEEEGHSWDNCCSVLFQIYQKCRWCGEKR